MAGLGKWIGGGLGWAFGGPIGALIGFAVGSMFDTPGNVVMNNQTTVQNRRTTEGDFKMSLLVMMACILKADGKVQKSELDVAKRFLVANFGEQGALEALQILKNLLEQPINETEVAMQINTFMNYSAKLQLIRLLFDIAYADGIVHENELVIIERIGQIFRITQPDFDSLKAPFVKSIDKDWAYKTLELEPDANVEDIKKAYRRMAMKFHPDKVHNLGEDVRKSATEKFRTLNEAYESLKNQRGFN